MRAAALLSLIFGNCAALACIVAPSEVVRDHGELVDEATAIVLLEAVEHGDSCALRVSRVLKGLMPDPLNIDCRTPQDGDWITDFSNHSNEEFWTSRAGRLGIKGDCSVIPPAFMVGKSYLAFLGVEPDTKQFEQLGDEGDRWLEFVESRTNEE